jgi:hypothetical protein
MPFGATALRASSSSRNTRAVRRLSLCSTALTSTLLKDDEVNPITSTDAFAHFQQDHGDRRDGDVDQQTATLVGAYITVIG